MKHGPDRVHIAQLWASELRFEVFHRVLERAPDVPRIALHRAPAIFARFIGLPELSADLVAGVVRLGPLVLQLLLCLVTRVVELADIRVPSVELALLPDDELKSARRVSSRPHALSPTSV